MDNKKSILDTEIPGQGPGLDKESLKRTEELFGDFSVGDIMEGGHTSSNIIGGCCDETSDNDIKHPTREEIDRFMQLNGTPRQFNPIYDLVKYIPALAPMFTQMISGKSQVEKDMINMFMSEMISDRNRNKNVGLVLSDVGMNLTLNTPEMIDIAIDVLRARRIELVKAKKDSEEIKKMQTETVKNLVRVVNDEKVKKRKYIKRKASTTPSTPKYYGE